MLPSLIPNYSARRHLNQILFLYFFNIYTSDSVRLHIINFLESIHSCVMYMNIEIASIIFEIFSVPEPATTSGTGQLLDRDTGGSSASAV